MSYSLDRRDILIDEILMKTVVESLDWISDEELERYEAWLLMQTDIVLQNKIIF